MEREGGGPGCVASGSLLAPENLDVPRPNHTD